jgi:hypothetical protein
MNNFFVSIQRVGGRTEKLPCESIQEAETRAALAIDQLEMQGHSSERANHHTVCMYRDGQKTYKISIQKQGH